MEFLFNLMLWGGAGALSLVLPGAAFGGLVRAIAHADGKVHERTLSEAIVSGLISGGLFLAAVGFLAGMVAGLRQPALEVGLRFLAVIVGSVLLLMAAAIAFGALAYFCVWLGVRGTGALLALAIVLGFAGIQAERVGAYPGLVSGIQLAVGLGGLALVVVLRVRQDRVLQTWPETADEFTDL